VTIENITIYMFWQNSNSLTMKVIAVLFAVCLALAAAAYNRGYVNHQVGYNRYPHGGRRLYNNVHSRYNSRRRFFGRR